jgi:hypothetical protein
VQISGSKGLRRRLRIGEAEELLPGQRRGPLPHLPRVVLDRLINAFLSACVVDVGVDHYCPIGPLVEIDA